MKPFLGIDLTHDKKNEELNGGDFWVQKTSAELLDAYKSSTDEAKQTIEKAKLPLPLRIIEYISGGSALIIAGGIAKADVSLQQAYANAPALFWAAGICAVVWLVLFICGKRKEKEVLDDIETSSQLSNIDSTSSAISAELGVPDGTKEIDVLSFFYKVKDGEVKITEKGLQPVQCINLIFKVFADADNLYFSNMEGKYAFARSSIVKIHTVKKHISIISWNKDEEYNKGIYKQYKLTEDKYGCIHCKEYHIIEINHNGEPWGVYIPSYDLPVIEEALRRE